MSGQLTISDRGGGNEFILDHAGARLSWSINAAGSFSAIVSDADARKWGASGVNWLGSRWLYFTHDDLPTWGGVISMMRWRPGILELAAESFHVLLRRRRVPRTYGQQSATAGALAQRAFHDVQADDAMLLGDFQADEWGDPIAYEWRGGDLFDDVFRELSSASGQEFDVDADRNVFWRIRLGSDKSGTVELTAGAEHSAITDYDYSGDLWTVKNDIEGVAADTKYADSAYDRLDDDASVRERGRYQVTEPYPSVVSKGTLRPKIKRDLERWSSPTQTATLTTANVAHIWGEYVLGDSIRVTLPGPNIRFECRIIARAIDVDSGLETLGVLVR